MIAPSMKHSVGDFSFYFSFMLAIRSISESNFTKGEVFKTEVIIFKIHFFLSISIGTTSYVRQLHFSFVRPEK